MSAKRHRVESLTRRRNVLLSLAVASVIAVAAIGGVLAIGRSSETAIVVDGAAPRTGALEQAPTLSGTDPITGRTVSLTDFAGKPVVVNIWANWCPGCRKEAPALRQLAKAHPEAVVLGIDFQDTVSGARSFGSAGTGAPSAMARPRSSSFGVLLITGDLTRLTTKLARFTGWQI